MSYNISTWKTKRLENLVIPMGALYDISEDLKQRGWMREPPRFTCWKDAPTVVRVNGLGEGYVSGEPSLLNSDMLMVSEITVYGEGSGTAFFDILKPALTKSTGVLEAVLIWEGGDSISRLLVEDGIVTESDIEL